MEIFGTFGFYVEDHDWLFYFITSELNDDENSQCLLIRCVWLRETDL